MYGLMSCRRAKNGPSEPALASSYDCVLLPALIVVSEVRVGTGRVTS